jgi:hypothetical protein
MNVYSDFPIPAFGRHVTLFAVKELALSFWVLFYGCAAAVYSLAQ